MRVLHAWTTSIVLMLLLWGATSTAAEYTLEDLYRVGMQKSERSGSPAENVEIADTGKYKALSALLPKATAFGAYQELLGGKSADPPVRSFSRRHRKATGDENPTRPCR